MCICCWGHTRRIYTNQWFYVSIYYISYAVLLLIYPLLWMSLFYFIVHIFSFFSFFFYIKQNLKQWWCTIPPILTKRVFSRICKMFFFYRLFVAFFLYLMARVLASSAVYRGFEPRSGQTKDYQSGICCFSAKHAVLRRKSKDWLAWNQDNVSEWGDIYIRGLLFQWTSTLKIQLIVLVYY